MLLVSGFAVYTFMQDRQEGRIMVVLSPPYKGLQMADKKKKEVWDTPDPSKKDKKLTPDQKSEAKARAKKAGRPYPNLVDNMAVSKKGKK